MTNEEMSICPVISIRTYMTDMIYSMPALYMYMFTHVFPVLYVIYMHMPICVCGFRLSVGPHIPYPVVRTGLG